EEVSGRSIMRLKKHQSLMRLGHPVMRQAMATLARQLHDPSGADAVYRWTIAALHRTGFEALLAFDYTVTAVNELREPLHDEVRSAVFRIEGDRLVRVDPEFEQAVVRSEFHSVRSTAKREGWVKTFRGRWFGHRSVLERFLSEQEADERKSLSERAERAQRRELDAAKESYRYRLKELQDRSREQELGKLAKALARVQAEAEQGVLFEEMRDEAEVRVQDIEEQMTVLRRDVERTRDLLTKEQDRQLKDTLPKRFTLLDGPPGLRVLPLAVTYLVPATAEDVRR
ncbi:MAG TPA: hypothetical protein VF170_04415, partial [Planctomycetaceae bacterium]